MERSGMDNKQEERKQLYLLLCKKEKEFEKAKSKRTTITLLGFTVFYFWIINSVRTLTGWYILAGVFLALVFAGIHVFVNALIFGTLASKVRSEEEYLKLIRQQIKDLENVP